MPNRLKSSELILSAVIVLLFSATAAASVTSADIIEFESNHDFYDGPVYLISTVSNYNTDEFEFFLDNRELSEGVSGETENTVTLDIVSQESRAVYGMRDPGREPIWIPEATTFTIDAPFWSSLEEKHNHIQNNEEVQNICWDLEGDGISQSDYFAYDSIDGFNYQIRIYCVTRTQQLGTVGEIASDPNDVFETEWELRNNEGKIERATISNADMGDGQCERIGPNSRVCFQGILSSGENSPTPTDELILHSNDIPENNGFRIIDREHYRDYQNSIPHMSSRIDQWGSDSSSWFFGTGMEAEDVTRAVRENAEKAASPHADSEFTDARFTGQDIGSGRIEVDLNNGIWPQFTVELRACRSVDLSECDAFVNIQRTVGQPQITEVDSTKFSELETGEIELTYQNVGSEEGSFAARVIECGEDFSFTGVSQRAVLNPGQSTTVNLPIGFSTTDETEEEIIDECTVEVEELGTGQTVTDQVEVVGQQQSECLAGEQFRRTQVVEVDGENLERDVIYECNENELGTHQVQTCDIGQQAVLRGREYECVETDNGPAAVSPGEECRYTLIQNPVGNNLTIPDPVCHFNNLVAGVYGTFTVIAVFFAFLFGYGQRFWIMSLAKLNGGIFEVVGRDVRISWIIGLITGLLFAWFTAGLLSNHLVKWGLILGVPAYLILKAYLTGPRKVVKSFLPI